MIGELPGGDRISTTAPMLSLVKFCRSRGRWSPKLGGSSRAARELLFFFEISPWWVHDWVVNEVCTLGPYFMNMCNFLGNKDGLKPKGNSPMNWPLSALETSSSYTMYSRWIIFFPKLWLISQQIEASQQSKGDFQDYDWKFLAAIGKMNIWLLLQMLHYVELSTITSVPPCKYL